MALSPVLRATLQAGILSALSNIIGQLITCHKSHVPYTINPTELFQFTLFSVLACPPNFLWQSWLEGQFPGYTDALAPTEKERLVDDAVSGKASGARSSERDPDQVAKRTSNKDSGAMTGQSVTADPKKASKKLNKKNTLIKFSLDQTIGAGVNTVLFLIGLPLLRGQTDLEILKGRVAGEFWPMIYAGQRLWPAVSVLQFTVVPFEYRQLVGSTVGLVWGVYLSLIAGAN
ncbi:hypothetical protein KC318_g4790 [Hortaea werneckii]|nr:hypothetical protein KC334_g5010 [Hortaea werneckii]KAI7013870.1 hypothetical protein KC355_g4878 [Hortaea werneckii]KAI7669236.1 hypothetical protein KC318_g4790 [Hortaea werneckii]